MKRLHSQREGAGYPNGARTVLATAVVMGLAALVWVHVDFDHRSVPIVESAYAPAAACAGDDCLRAPTGDPSVPSAASVFPDRSTSNLDVPPLPTF